MSAPAFTCTDPSTWPVLLTIDELAAILRRKVGGIRWSLRSRTFVPAPMVDPATGNLAKPLRWRRADVERYALGNRGGSSLRRVG